MKIYFICCRFINVLLEKTIDSVVLGYLTEVFCRFAFEVEKEVASLPGKKRSFMFSQWLISIERQGDEVAAALHF